MHHQRATEFEPFDFIPHQCVKAQEPDPYDGIDPSKLRAFLSQCKLVFQSSPQAFANNELKIMYTICTSRAWLSIGLSPFSPLTKSISHYTCMYGMRSNKS